jgi:hypothetical protein
MDHSRRYPPYADKLADYKIALERLTGSDPKLMDRNGAKRVLNLVDWVGYLSLRQTAATRALVSLLPDKFW